jgi:hypothetical protein
MNKIKYNICCHTRDFPQINEFIEHHLKLGFDKIVIYDNMSIEPIHYEHEKVQIIRWNEKIVDFNTYNHYLANHNVEGVWTAFIDEDEFINTNGVQIQEVMAKFQHYDSLGINWRVFSDKVDEDNQGQTLIEKYRYYAPLSAEISKHIKTFCKNVLVQRFSHPHFPIFKTKKVNRSVKGEIIDNAFCEPSHDTIWLDHYHMRGYEDYVKRQTRWIHILGQKSVQAVTDTYNLHKSGCTEKL